MCVCVFVTCYSQNVTDGHRAKRGTRTGGRGVPRCSSKFQISKYALLVNFSFDIVNQIYCHIHTKDVFIVHH